MIRLSELKAARAGMTSGPWQAVGSCIDGDLLHADGPVTIGRFEEQSMDADCPGIVATHNAADVLIEIVEAAKYFVDNSEDTVLSFDRGYRLLRMAVAKVEL